MINVSIIGCGAIFNRHLEVINESEDYNLISICDIEEVVYKEIIKKNNVNFYKDYRKCILESKPDLVVLLTPNYLHYEQAIFSLENNCDVLIEKPASFTKNQIEKIIKISKKNKKSAYCVLQVRCNNSVNIVKSAIDNKLLGNIRGASLIQRWQRPLEYFNNWRGDPKKGGGILHEVGIHYLDILQLFLGMPSVEHTKCYKTKHKSIIMEDTVYSFLDYKDFGCPVEITISSEPSNIECSITLQGSKGYIKLGGKALNEIEDYRFLEKKDEKIFQDYLDNSSKDTEFNDYGTHLGSCPNHKDVYNNLEKFRIIETKNVIDLIEKIYEKAKIYYH